jgi:hypothetical protein
MVCVDRDCKKGGFDSIKPRGSGSGIEVKGKVTVALCFFLVL